MSPCVAHALVFGPVSVVVAVAMDLWAALLHRRVWHGRLWSVHASHHGPREGTFERNDLFALVHAPIAVALILFGCKGDEGLVREIAFGVGIGMTIFAAAYLVVHDGLVHGRMPVQFLRRFRALRAVERAHRVHHTETAGGAPYGLFFGPLELEHRALRRARARASARH